MSSNLQFQPPEETVKFEQQAAQQIDIRDIPPLPEVALKVIEYGDDEAVNADEIGQFIARDQGLTGQILKIANSAYFGMKRQIGTIRHAAVVLGARRLRSAVVAASLGEVYSGTALGRILWEHSLIVAMIASELARIHRHSDPELAFVAGIMHDVGKSVIDTQYPESYVEVLEKISREQKSCLEAERSSFGFDHTHVGSIVADVWGLPKGLHSAIRYHHSTWEARHDPELTSLVYLADRVAQSIGIGMVHNFDLDLRELASETELEIDPGILAAVGEGVKVQFERERKFFGLA
jgi:putative nucleotidyltransferase with HDIG domain